MKQEKKRKLRPAADSGTLWQHFDGEETPMAEVDLSSRHPEIDPDTFVAEGARLIVRVILKSGASVWSG